MWSGFVGRHGHAASVDENDPEQAAADMMQMDAGVERMDADVQRWEDDDEAQDLGMEFPITDGNTTVAEVTNLERDAVLRNLGQGRDYLLPGRISPRSGKSACKVDDGVWQIISPFLILSFSLSDRPDPFFSHPWPSSVH